MIENRCAKLEGKYWRRPTRFTEALIGKSFGPMPYRWGGDSTPVAYRKHMSEGALAGDICTCRESAYNYCIVSEAVGVDCSGFVSRAWGLDKYGTSALYKVADALPSIFDLRPGDALNKAGSHVRLFTGFTPGANKLAQTIESTTKRECEGACEWTYSLAELQGYTPIRYRRITN